MHRSSESIGAIVAALAKAQVELTNPEKSLTAILPSPAAGGNGRSFRYAALSRGLDIVRKCLGRHEIAAIQTTAIDEPTGLIRLTTVLAHSSGEWVSSDWPVCPVAETAAPHRMGAALTHARRYSLFTLVGIAGEDDIDAPDVGSPHAEPNQSSRSEGRSGNGQAANGRAAQDGLPQRKTTPAKRIPKPVLDTEPSAKLRDALVAEIEGLNSADEATLWAPRTLRRKNTLKAEDAVAVERAFAERIAAFHKTITGDVHSGGAAQSVSTGRSDIGSPSDLDSRPVVQKGIRLRDKEHRKFVARQPCLVCGRAPSDPHHLRFAQPRALGRRVSDEFTVPLCRTHHRELHRRGNEPAWWQANKIDPIPLALKLWQERQFEQTGI